jgi:pSer/pThr/pTyr-binding forkhead associated (FHA) protein
MWILETLPGADAPLTFRLLPGAIKTLGRAPRVDFIVDAPLVSRIHCRFTLADGVLEVEDLESTNGTYVNGERVARRALDSGDTVKVGRVEFVARLA